MADIYSHSYLTIAASKSKDSTEGCYSRLEANPDRNLQFVNCLDEPYSITVWPKLEHPGDWYEHEKTFPLMHRAWAFQERWLSPRIVHFAPSELLWECSKLQTCGCRRWENKNSPGNFRYRKRAILNEHLRPGNIVEFLWHDIVQQYSEKALTVDGDIFPALQGLAKALHPLWNYHAGLWRDSFVSDLHWYTVKLRQPIATRSPVWRAPTWSWASIKGGVNFEICCNVCASVEEVTTVPVGADPFGQISSGILQLRGRCEDLDLSIVIPAFPSLDHGYPLFRYSPDLQIYQAENLQGEKVRLLELSRSSSRTADWYYLVLVCWHADTNEYERIGLLRVDTDGEYETDLLDRREQFLALPWEEKVVTIV